MKHVRPQVSLEVPVQRVEQHLAELHEAMRAGDTAGLETAAAALHRALTGAVDHFRAAAQQGGVPAALRDRLAFASARVAAHRLALARATASLDRAIDVLLPARQPTYDASGHSSRMSRGGSLSA